jgi:hypothetical protein
LGDVSIAPSASCQRTLLLAIRCFDGFDKPFEEGNNPYGERDFGKVTVKLANGIQEDFYFKIDYYDMDELGHSENNLNNYVTRCILTIMYCHEY